MSLVNALVQEFRIKNPGYDSNEIRLMQAGALELHRKQGAGWISNDLKNRAMMTTANNALKLMAFDYLGTTVRTTRPLTIPVIQNTSQLVGVTWVTFAHGFPMYKAQFFNNEADYMMDFDNKMKATINGLTRAIETYAVANLESNKTQVVNNVVNGHTFTLDTVHEIGATYNDAYIFADLVPMMASNDFYDVPMDVVGNQGLAALLNRQNGFGQANQENKLAQRAWLGNNFGFSNLVTNLGAKKATGYAVNENSVGLLTRVEPDSFYRTELKSGHTWDRVTLPGIELEFGSYYYDDAVDASSLDASQTHLTRTGVEFFDFAIDIAFICKYNSDPNTIPSPIMKFDWNITSGS